MNTTFKSAGIRQAGKLYGFYARKRRHHLPTTLAPRTNIPPLSFFEAAGVDADLLDHLTRWHTLAAQVLEHRRLASAATVAADAAAEDHRLKVKAAIAAGSDPSKLKSKVAAFKAEAEEQGRYAEMALGQQTRLGIELGPLLEKAAPSLYAHADATIEAAAEKVRTIATYLEEPWAEWSTAFSIRRWLSSVELSGSNVGQWHPGQAAGTPAQEGIEQMLRHLDSLEHLRSDEAEVRAFRAANNQ